MELRLQTIRVALLAAVLLFPIGAAADGLGKDKNLNSNETTYTIRVSKEGIGADQYDAVYHATELIQQGKLAEAERELDAVLDHFAGLMSDDKKIYVSFRDDDDYKQYTEELGRDQRSRVVRLHDSFSQALQMKAFIASSQEQWDKAISYLERKMKFAPYEAQPYLEKGYVLNSQGKPREALESYKKAYALGTAHHAAKKELAAAYRGMGTSLIDLGRLDDAEDAFNKSLEIDPGNRIALNELEYIRKVRARGR
jgi:tetratricopeptide (TPR) repeat protein